MKQRTTTEIMTERESESAKENVASNFRVKIYCELRSSREFGDIEKYETELVYDKVGCFISLELKCCTTVTKIRQRMVIHNK